MKTQEKTLIERLRLHFDTYAEIYLIIWLSVMGFVMVFAFYKAMTVS